MHEFVLPICNPPIIQTTSDYADMFTILPLHSDFQNWLGTHYSNLVYLHTPDENYQINFCSEIYTDCELLDYDIHSSEMSMSEDEIGIDNVVDYIKKLISKKYYAIVETNQYHIPGTSYYRKIQYMHRQLFYGYSDIYKCFYTLGYNKQRKYRSLAIPYEEIPKATIEYDIKLAAPIHTIKLNNNSYAFDKHKAATDYYYYCNNKYNGELTRSDYIFGINATEKFHEIIDAALNTECINVILPSLFYEHKYVQKIKLQQYLESGIIGVERHHLEVAESIMNDAYKILILYMKYTLDRKRELLSNSHKYIDRIVSSEKKLYPDLVRILEL